MNNQDFVYGTSQALNENKFTKYQYKFKEWNTSSDGTGTSYSDKKVVNNLTKTDGGTVKLYAIYELNMLSYQIITDQADAEISVTVDGTTKKYTGSCSLTYVEGTSISFEITKWGYKTISVTETITKDTVHNYTMEELSNHTLTLVANTNKATINVKCGDRDIASTTNGTVTFKAYDGFTYSYSASAVGYYDASGNYTMPASNTTYNITLEEMPWITGTTSNTSRTTAATKTDTNYHPGYYLIEVWGGTGGNGKGANSGTAGYVYGVVYIDYNATIYATAGGNGADQGNNDSGGANGGGKSGSDDASSQGSGGGYSAFAVGTASMTLENAQNGNIKLIAGGSGGGSGKSGSAGLQSAAGTGGNGGTLSSASTAVTGGTAFTGTAGTYGKSKGGGGAGYTSGGSSEKGSAGAFMSGGDAHGRGGGGGAGYYGGGGGSGYNSSTFTSSTNWGPGGGGGGSSFVATGVTYSNLPGSVTSKLVGTNPSSTGGAVIITWIGESL